LNQSKRKRDSRFFFEQDRDCLTPKSSSRFSSKPPARSGGNALFFWTLFILLLVGAAIASWLGSFYIFGHPENPVSYRVLKQLKKLEPPKRFELTAAPRGEFLGPDRLLERYESLTPRQLASTNAELLRNFIRNYQNSKDPLPYVIGDFVILDSFELSPNDFFGSGVVALGQAKENPRVLLEHIFPADERSVPILHRMLLTGLDMNLRRRFDISAVIHVEKLQDGRMKFTAVPLLYGSYVSSEGTGSFSLEPPRELNVEAGMPLLRRDRVDLASQKYADYRRRAGLDEYGTNVARATAVNQLVRVERPLAVPGVDAPIPPPENDAEMPDLAEARALPADLPVLPALPIEEVASPVEEIEIAMADPVPEPTPEPSPTPVATPAPSPTPAPAIASPTGSWQVYQPGRMPRGRLLNVPQTLELADRGLAGERVYLQGNFVVTASGDNRAVLRSQSAVSNPLGGGRTANVRIIVDFPPGGNVPPQGATFGRDASRPFQITGVSRGDDGQINVRAREITTP